MSHRNATETGGTPVARDGTGGAGEVSAVDTLLEILRAELDVDLDQDDDFYAMGGDSLIAVKVVAEANARGLPIRLIDLLSYPTAAELAEYVASAGGATGAPDTGAARDTGADSAGPGPQPPAPDGVTVLPASALQIGLIYLCETSDDPQLYNDLIGMRVTGPFRRDRFAAALRRLVARHPALRSCFDLAADPEAVQLVYDAVDPPLAVDEVPGGTEAEADALVAAWRDRQLSAPFDWERAPLFRCHVVALDDAFRLTTAIHHAIMDGWSFSRTLVDLLTLYDAELDGRQPELPPPPADGHQRFLAAEAAVAAAPEAAAFWRAEADVAPLLLDRDRFSGAADPCARRQFLIDPSTLAGLRRTAAAAGTPLKSLLLAVHCWALGRWTGRLADVVTGVVMNGRPEVEGADLLVGLFLNTVPLRMRSLADDWSGLARAALAVERAATPYRRFPLAAIEHQLGRRAFDVSFNFTDFRAYAEVERLRHLRVDGWWAQDKASDPLMCDYTIDYPGFGTGVVASFDEKLIPAERVDEFMRLVRAGLGEAATAAGDPAPAGDGVRKAARHA